jgi:hypothetical protein
MKERRHNERKWSMKEGRKERRKWGRPEVRKERKARNRCRKRKKNTLVHTYANTKEFKYLSRTDDILRTCLYSSGGTVSCIVIQINAPFGRAVAQAVARVRARARTCGIYGGQRGTGTVFLRVLPFPLPIIPPIAPHSSSSGAGTIGQQWLQ